VPAAKPPSRTLSLLATSESSANHLLTSHDAGEPRVGRKAATAALAAGDPNSLPRRRSQWCPGEGVSFASAYGCPAPLDEVLELLPAGGGGLIWRATLVSDDWSDPSQCSESGEIRPRRPTLPVRASDFFKSLVQTEDGRWIFSGVLNGWPGLNCLELCLITCAGLKAGARHREETWWDVHGQSQGGAPSLPPRFRSAHATLRMPPWTAQGWSKDSPGWVWWFFAQRAAGPVLAFGRDMVCALRADLRASGKAVPQAVAAHLFFHRYALGKGRVESRADLVTYHAAVLVEWDHGLHASVVELGPLHGVTARCGRSDWYHDKLEATTALGRALPSCMAVPWRDDLAEIRCSDVQARGLAEFRDFVRRYAGHDQRFVDPRFQHSGRVRLSQRSQAAIMQALLNYMTSERRFAIETRNCQTFACDFYAFLVGAEGIEPLNPALAEGYVKHIDWFLYGPPPVRDCRPGCKPNVIAV